MMKVPQICHQSHCIKLIQPTEAECRHTSAARLGHLLCLCIPGQLGGVKISNFVILQGNTKCPHLILLLHQLSHCVLGDVSVLEK